MSEDDRIGYIGQNEFFSLCERERLYASRPDPDRTGKDFVVEWKLDEGQIFDTRPPPRKCQVQIKSTRIGSLRVGVKLSAAEWLAKDLNPSFVLCPVFNEEESVDHYVGFHIADDLLYRILARLRQASVGDEQPNRVWIWLTLAKGAKLKPGEVRVWLEEESGADMARYAAEKDLALKTLGYDDEGEEYTMTFAVESVAEIVECLMGERELDATISRPQRIRFGIKAEESGKYVLPPTGRISIEPSPNEHWVVETIDEEGSPQASIELQGHTVAFPGLPPEHWRSDAANEIVAVTFVGPRATVTFRAADMLQKPHDLDELIASVEFWLSLIACDGRLRIQKQGQLSPDLKISSVSSSLDAVLERSLELLRAVRSLYTYCQIAKVTVIYEVLTERAHEIISAARQMDLRQTKEPWVVIECEPDNVEEIGDRFVGGASLLMTFPAIVGEDILGLAVAYAVTPERETNNLKLRATSRFPIRGRKLNADDPIDDYREFVSGIRDEVTPAFHALIPLVDASDANEE